MYLPTTVVPRQYDLYLAVHIASAWEYPGGGSTAASDRAMGAVNITVDVLPAAPGELPWPCLVLHSSGMNITSVGYVATSVESDSTYVHGRVAASSGELEQVVLAFDSPLPSPSPGATSTSAVIVLEFEYAVEHGLDGLYTSTYHDGAADVGTLVSTQMEPTSARKVLPCFDEPAMRARFAVTIAAAPGLDAVLSNMPKERRALASAPPGSFRARAVASELGMTEHAFAPTPPMSTYLLAFVMGELDSVSMDCMLPDVTGEGERPLVPVAVWATPASQGQLDRALAVACLSLQTYSESFGVAYTLPKLDLVGIPAFSAGAMENWGLMTFRESSLLVDALDDDVAAEERIALTVAHEISHQWFGDLVTVGDWSELWLKEGFATYFENLAAQVFRPGFRYWDMFYTDITSIALGDDAVPSVHPLSLAQRARTPAQIDNMYDGISYEKGGAVLRMLRAYLAFKDGGSGVGGGVTDDDEQMSLRRTLHQAGPSGSGGGGGSSARDPLLLALTAFLNEFKFGSVTHTQLWDALAASTQEPVREIMAAWATQPGYPVVSVSWAESGRVVALSQRPVMAAKGASPGRAPECGPFEGQARWQVPIAMRLAARIGSTQPAPLQWLLLGECSEDVVVLGADAGDEYAVGDGGAVDGGDGDDVGDINGTDDTGVINGTDPAVNDTDAAAAANADWPEYVVVNAHRYGYYRVNYSSDMWDAIGRDAASPQLINAHDLAGLLDDAYQLSYQGQLSATAFLSLTTSLGPRTDAGAPLALEAPAWHVALRHLGHALALMDTAAVAPVGTLPPGLAYDAAQCAGALRAHVRSAVTGALLAGTAGATAEPDGSPSLPPALSFAPNGNESLPERLLRPHVLMAAGAAGDPSTLSAAAAMLLTGSSSGGGGGGGGSVAADVRGVVYVLSGLSGSRDAFEQMQRMYSQPHKPPDGPRLVHGMAAFATDDDAGAALALLAPGNDLLNLQDVGSFLRSVAGHGGRRFYAAWHAVQDPQWMSALAARFPGAASYSLGRPLKDMLELVVDWQLAGNITQFASAYESILDPDFAAEVADTLAKNTAWLSGPAGEMCAWLTSQHAGG